MIDDDTHARNKIQIRRCGSQSQPTEHVDQDVDSHTAHDILLERAPNDPSFPTAPGGQIRSHPFANNIVTLLYQHLENSGKAGARVNPLFTTGNFPDLFP